MADSNKDRLLSRLNELRSKPVYTSLEVYSKGNKIYLLKDSGFLIYILIVPKSPLDENQHKALISFGFKEIWAKVNYEKYLSYSASSSLNQLIEDIDFIFTNVFNVEFGRKWRFELNTGMAVLKDNTTPLLTASERRRNTRRKRSQLKVIFNDVSYSLMLSVIVLLGLFSKHLIDALTLRIILFVLGGAFAVVKFIRFMTTQEFSSFGKKRFFSSDYSDYFNCNGFERQGDRYKGNIDGFSVELMFSELFKNVIIVYHKPISWDRVLRMPKSKPFSSISYSWVGMFYSQKRINRRLSKEKVIHEAKDFVELLVKQKIEKQHTP